jgi:hypothetical protein
MFLERDVDRREFLRRAARWTLLTVSLIGTGGLVGKKGQACALAAACRECDRFRGCDLPQAQQTRRIVEGR